MIFTRLAFIMAKSPPKKRPAKRKTDAELIRRIFPKEVLEEVAAQLKDSEPKRDNQLTRKE
jgi:hypothetical protein